MLCDVLIASCSSTGLKGWLYFSELLDLKLSFFCVVFESKKMWIGVVDGRIGSRCLS